MIFMIQFSKMMINNTLKFVKMKNLFFPLYFFLLSGLLSCQSDDGKVTAKYVKNPVSAQGVNSSVELPSFEVVSREEGSDGKSYDFGVIIQGENVVHTFEIKNVSHTNLLITSASASCGCTVPTFSRDPILPGKTGKVEVAFSSSGRSGKQIKSIVLTTNAQPSTITLTIIANVVVPI